MPPKKRRPPLDAIRAPTDKVPEEGAEYERFVALEQEDLELEQRSEAERAALATGAAEKSTQPSALPEKEEPISRQHRGQIAKLRIKRIELEIKRLENKNASREQDTNLRRLFARILFWLTATWLASVLGIIVGVGCRSLRISDKVLISLVAGISLNILGLFAIVVNYLFPKRRNGSSRRKAS